MTIPIRLFDSISLSRDGTNSYTILHGKCYIKLAEMKGIKQPVGFVKLTNVSIVRLKKHGIRFELACYKNKVQDWKNGV